MSDEIKIDYEALIQQIKDQATIELMKAIVPDEHIGQLMAEVLSVFVKHGVSVDVAIKIIMEIDQLGKQKENE